MTTSLFTGDCREILPTLEAESFDCIVTSPPYWGLRDYGTAEWTGGDPACDHLSATKHQAQGATSARSGRSNVDEQRNETFRSVCGKCGAQRVDRQIGLEPTLDGYVDTIAGVARELWRVLKPSGTFWLNLGDCYSAHPGQRKTTDKVGDKQASNHGSVGAPSRSAEYLKPKDLCMVPARVALRLQADGWWLRKEIIWAKPNPMPESVTDRPTSSHEKVYLFAKAENYFYDAAAIAEEAARPEGSGNKTRKLRSERGGVEGPFGSSVPWKGETRNARDVWTIATQPYAGAHFAVMPSALAERCILAGCPERICSACGAPWVRETERIDQGWDGSKYGERAVSATGGAKSGGTKASTLGSSNGRLTGKMITIGFAPSCSCHAEAASGRVLDPFGGAGTTGLVADRLGRHATLIDLNLGYKTMMVDRITSDAPLFADIK